LKPIVEFDGLTLDLKTLNDIALNKTEVKLNTDAKKKMLTAREYVLKIVEKGEPVYGINTGFGALSNKFIGKSDLKTLQYNLIRSHCTGIGQPLNQRLTRAMMALRANCLASGFSGVNPEIVELILEFLNKGIHPIIPEKGSVGASGDLAPLSHIALSLIGEGEVEYLGKKEKTKEVMDRLGIKPAELGPKDGLALINGTALMTAYASVALMEAEKLFKLADISACLTVDGIKGSIRAYFPHISKLKPHPGQMDSVSNLNKILPESEILNDHQGCPKVQDPYSLRCVPQVHGACRQTYYHLKQVVETELNSVTDNPLIFVEEDQVVSGGNFHGQALSLSMDYMAMGLAEICSISERRIEKMMNPTFSELPAFLTQSSGLNSGLMIAHVTAAALASENKTLCHPASIDSIPTSTDKEDHVSMGPFAGRKLHQVIENTKTILAVEILCNTAALDYQRPLKSSPACEAVYEKVREVVPKITEDRVFAYDMNKIIELINKNELIEITEKLIGELR